MRQTLLLTICFGIFAKFSIVAFVAGAEPVSEKDLFAEDNLVAWCIVPFDAKKRGPAERAEMLVRLGLKRVAYDWREEHVATFEEEILQYKKHELEFFAFWDVHEEALKLFEKYDLHPQIWRIAPTPNVESQAERVAAAAKQMLPYVNRAKQLGCKFGIYNHGGWSGEPENMIAICKWLHEHAGGEHVGIVYNFHHGHEHIEDFGALLDLMKPYLLCLNINGMNTDAKPKIVSLGQGEHERKMLQTVLESGYAGPIGILDHRVEMDAEESLGQNLDGLKAVVKELE